MYCERIEELPIIIQIAQNMSIDLIFDKHIPSHKNRKGLPYGKLAIAWIGFILSRTSHCKSHVSSWCQKVNNALTHILKTPLDHNDFTDRRLSLLLNHLSDDDVWYAIENDLWKFKIDVYSAPINGIRLDATTCHGYHEIQDNGIMQIGHSSSKQHHLPQLKLMGAAEADKGHLIALDTASGNKNDDVLYVPLILRLRSILGNVKGLLYCGDCKMSSLETRAIIAQNNDFYITPLQMNTENIKNSFQNWVEDAVSGKQELINIKMNNKLIAKGYELERIQNIDRNNIQYSWNERLLITRSESLADQQIRGLEKRLTSASIAISKLTQRKQKWEQKELIEKIESILTQNQVQGLLKVNFSEKERIKIFKRTEKRNGKQRQGSYSRKETNIIINNIERLEDEIKKVADRMGWKLHVTNTLASSFDLEQAIVFYREEWKIEQQFHFIKDKPIGISPLYVWKEEQLKGMCRFLSIVLRVWTHIRIKVIESLEKSGEVLRNIYKGVPTKKTKAPTGKIILDVFEDIILCWIDSDKCQVNAISPLARELLRHLGVSEYIYEDLANSCKKIY